MFEKAELPNRSSSSNPDPSSLFNLRELVLPSITSTIADQVHLSHRISKLLVTTGFRQLAEAEPVELLERKGIGHPDSLADLVAEHFSCSYSQYCLRRFGCVLSHWVDKVLLAGGVADLDFGKAEIRKPITAYLFGRVSIDAFGEKIDFETLFRNSVSAVFNAVFPGTDIVANTLIKCDVNVNLGKDHPKDFFGPSDRERFNRYPDLQVANDSVVTCAYAPFSVAEFLTVEMENHINGPEFKQQFPETGSDVKVLTVRSGSHFDVTVCVPFLAVKTPSHQFYKDRVRAAQVVLDKWLKGRLGGSYTSEVHINTKDREEFAYLTAFGTSLDKGDYGAVGRGNKPCGIISVTRESNIEAVCGKNPANHSGKIYNYLAQQIANEIWTDIGGSVCVNIACRNGAPLSRPACVAVKLSALECDVDRIAAIVIRNLDGMADVTRTLIQQDPVSQFISQKVAFGSGDASRDSLSLSRMRGP